MFGEGDEGGEDDVPPIPHPDALADTRRRAVEYAREWADGHNPAYDNYDSENWIDEARIMFGGAAASDCTNFGSQVLEAGGFERDDSWYDNKGRMWNQLGLSDGSFTTTWTLASDQYEWITSTGRGAEVGTLSTSSGSVDQLAPSRAGLIPGDFIYFRDSDGNINHTMVYVGRGVDDSGNPVDIVCQHSSTSNKDAPWMPVSDAYTTGLSEAIFVHVNYPPG